MNYLTVQKNVMQILEFISSEEGNSVLIYMYSTRCKNRYCITLCAQKYYYLAMINVTCSGNVDSN